MTRKGAHGGVACLLTAALLSQAPTYVAIYAPLFGVSYHGGLPRGFVVSDSSVAMPTLQGSSPDWLRQFDDVPAALRRAASRTEPTRVRPLDLKSLPAGIRTVPSQATRAVLAAARASGTSAAWETFKREYNANGWLAFSDPVLDSAGLEALVYYEAECGGLCGETGYAWLHRDSLQSDWTLEKKIVRRLK